MKFIVYVLHVCIANYISNNTVNPHRYSQKELQHYNLRNTITIYLHNYKHIYNMLHRCY